MDGHTPGGPGSKSVHECYIIVAAVAASVTKESSAVCNVIRGRHGMEWREDGEREGNREGPGRTTRRLCVTSVRCRGRVDPTGRRGPTSAAGTTARPQATAARTAVEIRFRDDCTSENDGKKNRPFRRFFF